MTNYFNFVETIKRLSMNHGIVNETGEGDIYLHLNSGTHKYPCVFLTVQNITKRNDTLNVNGTLFYVDKMLDNSANKTEIQSNAITILSQVVDKISEDSVYEMNAGTYTPFEEKFSDLCAGAFVSFTCTFPDEIVCSDSEYTIKTITLTSNGVYDIVGYDKAIVEVCSEAQWGDITGDIENQQDLIDLVESVRYDDTQIYSDLSAETSERISEDERLEEKIDSNKSDIDALGEYTFGEVVPTTTNFNSGETWNIKAFEQRVADLNAGQSNINSEVNTKLGNCTAQNPAADRGFVNSSIASAAANFRGNWPNWNSVPTNANLYPVDYVGNRTPTNNDYCVVTDCSDFDNLPFAEVGYNLVLYPHFKGNKVVITYNDGTVEELSLPADGSYLTCGIGGELSINGGGGGGSGSANIKVLKKIKWNNNIYEANTFLLKTGSRYQTFTYNDIKTPTPVNGTWRLKYSGDWDVNGKLGWNLEYKIGSSFTAAQQAALDSGINSTKVNKYEGYESTLSNLSANKVDKINTANKIYGTNANSQQVSYEAGENITFSQVVESGVTKYKINASSTKETMYIEYGDDDNVVEKLRYAVQNNILPIVHFYDDVQVADFYVPLTYIYLDGEESYYFCTKVDYDGVTYYGSESMLTIIYWSDGDEWSNEFHNDVIPVLYNETTYSELSTHMAMVNCVFVYEDAEGIIYHYQFVKTENNTYYFNRVDGNNLITVSLDSNDVWSKTTTELIPKSKKKKPLIVSRALPLGSTKRDFNFKMMWGNRYLINLKGGIFFRARNISSGIYTYIQDKIDSVADIVLYRHPTASEVIIQDNTNNDDYLTDYVHQSQSVIPNDWNGKIIYTVGEIESWKDLVDELFENLFVNNTGCIQFLNDNFCSETASPNITVDHCVIQCHRSLPIKEVPFEAAVNGVFGPYVTILPPFSNNVGDLVDIEAENAKAKAIATTIKTKDRVATFVKKRGLKMGRCLNGSNHQTPGSIKKMKSHFVKFRGRGLEYRSYLYKYSYKWRGRKISDLAYYAHGCAQNRVYTGPNANEYLRGPVGMHIC